VLLGVHTVVAAQLIFPTPTTLHGDAIGITSDLQFTIGVRVLARHHCIMALCKLVTSVQFGTGQRVVTLLLLGR